MRPVTQSDISAAARVLLRVPPDRREQAARHLVERAVQADLHRLTTGRHHPRYGNGTLLSAALAHDMANPATGREVDFLAAMASVIEQILAIRSGE